jgi:plastocyanin
MKRLTLFAVIAVLAVGASACSDKSKVGSGVNTGTLKGGGNAAIRDTTTTAAPVTTAPPTTKAPATTQKPVATTQKPVATTQQAQVAITIGIYSDTSGKNQFEPRQAGVQRGSTVRWQNFDTTPRSVEDSNGAFKSPMIPPGGTWDFKATTAGKFNYSDGTRPYAVGELNVV